MNIPSFKKAHNHTQKGTLQRHGADLHVKQAAQNYLKYHGYSEF